jgi:PPOX class probable F420-dependent enzyme
MDEADVWDRLKAARVGHLATSGPDGTPHVVPFVFAVEGRTIYWIVDAKPKRSRELKRVANIRANPDVEVVVDNYQENWRELWWVRAKGVARILEPGKEWERGIRLLTEKYRQYESNAPPGPVVAIDVVKVVGWEAGAGRRVAGEAPAGAERSEHPRGLCGNSRPVASSHQPPHDQPGNDSQP